MEETIFKIEKDTLVYVRDYYDGIWQMRYFSHFEGGTCCCFDSQLTSKQTSGYNKWDEWSLENPLL